ncbi:MAG: glucokinase [Gloeomargarita sp. SKYBB_i_bin120]|nr:glucokinase [Gloeomargarita sp. SKYG98]MCS7292269.1 glucokinase [Gloeomargarita sp. SKYB120]MDW8177830.1 glucokinase [Gloeomargarita sp. SKYBB_i_bin120]
MLRPVVLVGDIGGTNTRLELLHLADPPQVLSARSYRNDDYPDLTAIGQAFLAQAAARPELACLAVAGPVEENTMNLTNRNWRITGDALAQQWDIPQVRFLNDLEAVGYGLLQLTPADWVVLQEGKKVPGAPIGVVAAGTGLGECFLTWDGQQYRVWPSEGGHVDFAPRNDRELGLWRYLQAQFGRVSAERVVSGPGLWNIYRYLAQVYPEQAKAEILARQDPAMITACLHDPLCSQAVDIFIANYGSEAGNLALKLLARGGIYLAGGIAPQLVERFQQGGFLRAFSDKGRMGPLLAQIPVYLITNPRVGLLGATAAARSFLAGQSNCPPAGPS